MAPSSRKPSLEDAIRMPTTIQELDNSELFLLAESGNNEACAEVLKKHIMRVDRVGYDIAASTFQKIERKNNEGKFLLSLPYRIGIAVSLTAGFGALPMVFDLGTAEWFNTYYVTTEVPEPADLETVLETGSWTWNWMEPPLGTISFLLLCLQYSRAQLDNLGIKPYTSKMKEKRGRQLARAFPKYDERLLVKYSMSSDLYT